MLNTLSYYSNAVGVVGVVLTLIAYYFLNINKWSSTSKAYLLLNFFGSWLILFSLMFHWNLASVLIEIAWITISVIGLYRVLYVHKPANLTQLFIVDKDEDMSKK